MTKEFFKEIALKNNFIAEFVKYREGLFIYNAKIRYFPNEDAFMKINRYVKLHIPLDVVKDKDISSVIDVVDYYEYAFL